MHESLLTTTPKKDDPNRVRITVGGNLIDYPYELTTRTADMVSAKIIQHTWSQIWWRRYQKHVSRNAAQLI
jgi:hypothetical protein